VLGPLSEAVSYTSASFVSGIGSVHDFWRKDSIIASTGIHGDRAASLGRGDPLSRRDCSGNRGDLGSSDRCHVDDHVGDRTVLQLGLPSEADRPRRGEPSTEERKTDGCVHGARWNPHDETAQLLVVDRRQAPRLRRLVIRRIPRDR